MTSKEMQWVLSLSCLSLLGPKCDIDDVKLKGFYKKCIGYISFLETNIDFRKESFKSYEKAIKEIYSYYDIVDAISYTNKIEELIGGSIFASNMERLLQLGRTMTLAERANRRPIVISGHLFFYEMFEMVMKYEFHWPKKGLVAYDLASAIMLLRTGVIFGYLTPEIQNDYFEKVLSITSEHFKSFEQFGIEAEIGRKIQLRWMALVNNNLSNVESSFVLEMSYYGIWQYIEI